MQFLKERLQIVQLPDITNQELDSLKQKVERANHHLFIFMHPFLHEDAFNNSRSYTISTYRTNRDQLIQQHLADYLPLVILEGSSEYQSLARRIKGRGTVYTCITRDLDPTPLMDPQLRTKNIGGRSSLVLSSPREDGQWNKFAYILQQIGVHSVTVGGQFLLFFDSSDYSNPYLSKEIGSYFDKAAHPKSGTLTTEEAHSSNFVPSACVGTLTRELIIRGFDVSISRIYLSR